MESDIKEQRSFAHLPLTITEPHISQETRLENCNEENRKKRIIYTFINEHHHKIRLTHLCKSKISQ